MHLRDKEKSAFMTDCDNFYYEVIPFGLKNVRTTYQRLMDQIFKGMLDRNVKVYIDIMVVKTYYCVQHIQGLKEVFKALRDHGMRLNPDKYAFEVEGGKFLGFMLIHRGIEENQEKCKAITKMRSLKNKK